MTRRLSLFLIALFTAALASAQPTNLPAGLSVNYFTSFETPAPFDSVTSTGVPGWVVDPNYRFPAGSGQAILGKVDGSQTSFLTTNSFSTVGQFKVWLDFAHICKVEFVDSATIQISTNGGTTWTNLLGTNCIYEGASTDFRTRGRFSHFSYPANWAPGAILATPAVSWWRNERFDISTFAANQADVRVRFRLKDSNGDGMGIPVPGGYGWLIDSVLVTSAFSELYPPLIAHSALTGLQFNIAQTFSATVTDSFGCDSTGVLDAWLFYRINYGVTDSIQMNRQGTSTTWSVLLDTNLIADGDTVSYFIRARDSSPSANIKYFPLMGSAGDTFITYVASVFPTMSHTPTVGQQFSAGPFVFNVNASDASGVDSVILNYRFNSGPWQLKKMPNISGVLHRDTLFPIDGDTVRYYIDAVDNSPRRFRKQLPDTAAFWTFIASGDPDVTWPSSSAQCDVFLGALFELGPFNIGVKAEDGSGIDTVFLYYRLNSGAYDSVGMIRNPVSSAFCNWLGTVPAVSDSDTISYYVKAIDASVRNNFRIAPAQGTPRQFVALAGIRFPYVDDFNASDVWRGYVASGLFSNPVLTPGGWVRGAPAKSIINSARSAPNAWVPGPLNANYPNSAWFILESPVFDFALAENATLSFWQWRDINNGNASQVPGVPGQGDGFWLEYTTNVNATNPTWVKLGNASATDTNQANWYNRVNINGLQGAIGGAWDGARPGWERAQIRLIQPQFQGASGAGSIKFRFVFRSNASIQANGVAIDDFSITLPAQRDIAITTIASNTFGTPIAMQNNNFQVYAGDPFSVFVRMRNFGLQIIDTIIPVVVEVGSFRDTTQLTLNGPILPNAFTSVSYRLDTIPAAPAGWYTVKVYSILTGDEVPLNDTLSIEMYGVPVITVPNSDNFDGPNDDWLAMAVGNNPIIWQRGLPTGNVLGSAFSAPNVWGTNLAGPPPGNTSGRLFSPVYNFNNAVNSTLRFKMNRRLGTGAALRIAWVDGLFTNFSTLGTANDPTGMNWYNAPNAAIAGVPGPAWTGQSATFVTHSIELPPAFDYRMGRGVRFRIDFQNSTIPGAEGVVIDDWEIIPPPPREIGILGIVGPVACPDSIKAIDSVRVLIKNFGGDTLYQIPFNFNFNNGPLVLANDFIYMDTIPPAATRTVTLPSFASPQPAANYNMKVFTKLTGDARTSNDTVSRCIKTIPPVDLLIVQVLSPPPSICFPSGPRQVRFRVRNIGNSNTVTFTAGFKVDTLPSVIQTFNLSIPPNGFDTITITQPLLIPNGQIRVKIFVNDSNDPVRGNDTSAVDIFGRIPVALTHINNFEGTNPLPYCTFTSPNAMIEVRDNVNNSVNNSSAKTLYMGAFQSATTFNPNVPANPWVDTWNGAWLARVVFPVETDNRNNIRIRFRLLQIAGGNLAADRISLFRVVANGVQIGPTIQPTAATPGNQPYVQYDFRLDTVYDAGQPLLIEFQSKARWRLLTTGTSRNGNFIDDVIIYNAVPNSAEIMDVIYNPPFPSETTPVTVTAKVRNGGTNILQNVQLNLEVNGTVIQTVNAPVNLPFMQDTNYSFTTTFNPLLGSNDVCVYSALPNGTTDDYPLDDTLCTEAIGFPVISNFPYCNDFDSGLPEWLTRNPVTLRSGGNNWQLGTPQKGFINGAASGANAWYIGADSLYGAYDSSALYTPIFELNAGECYRVSFKSKWLTDFFNNNVNNPALLGDGGTLEYSTDGGANFTHWGAIDTITDEWYNNIVFSLRDFSSSPNSLGLGWTAISDSTYTEMRQVFNVSSNGLVIFRFRFASDDAFHGEGFVIDDFCFEIVPGPCRFVSIDEEDMDVFTLRQNYPNPFNGTTAIGYTIPNPGRVQVMVKDLLGRSILNVDEGMLDAGDHETQLDLAGLEAGVYFYTVRYAGVEKTMKMIVSK